MLRTVVCLLGVAVAAGCSSAPKVKQLSRSEKIGLHMQIIEDALLSNDTIAALTQINLGEKEFPDAYEFSHARAVTFAQRGDLAQAIQSARKAVSQKPSASDANNTLGKLLMDAGKNQEAITYLNRAANDPLYREGHKSLTSLGIIYYRKGDLERALNYLTRAVDTGGERACVAYYYRGHAHLQKNQLKLAIQDYDKASRKTCAGFTDAHYALGFAREKSREFNEARKKYVEIQKLFPDSPFAEQARKRMQGLP